ncbi:glyceraldehyde-3-phosphate dehydrogenase, type I [Cryptococcus gattii Ru294]|uniref:Glyceraldehyde-3-phosphate dehydrogenase n=2 Tax=Cryptococcus gattii TaxID=37769 RepID=E6RAC7_CRYGW|nr:Glyceraldehyde 3-phosphate dehydrogenase, putative [Cryptococcus gattii WM276]KIR56783.1 glyceraldehyde-3-phosphate dehydrogenase, type I [Cryptococcus gattii Ru294]KIR81494.1 glyceraldehyde-3-phosphate dehydrogenase, type I [Cryptococcus gattii EJB2]KIY31808.1 glyceraldehyde-3-phosphate dehydrogenase, type I [Cryptococcus gattii E566]KJE02235.1 glyceraldehyde-3-phosphate dehydrogenase, type I [Cryptococcus gattii NT-10]ADV23759.1 Glyceraldehyde 3-phosphate dehydrogenase, putative [Cryptoco
MTNPLLAQIQDSFFPPCRVGINGFGRIGRAAFRASLERDDLIVVAINHTAPSIDYLLHAIKYDSTHGTSRHANDLSIKDGALYYKDRRIELFSQRDPLLLDWKSAGVEYVVESTGKMTTVATAGAHIKSGARKVVISAPSKDAKTIVVGVNRKEYNSSMSVVSNASCTTNCLAPLAKVLNRAFGIEFGMMTTVHASTSSQPILDGYSKKNRRLGRGVGSNIIPTTTGAATAVQLVLPELAGKFTGVSVRVPVNNVSMVDLTVRLNKPVASKEELFRPIREASTGLSSLGPLANVLCVNDDELVSSDFLGWQHSCIVDSAASVMLNDRVFKIIAWYDNEYGYACRLLDLVRFIHEYDNGKVPTPTASGVQTPSGAQTPVLRAF